MHSTNLVLVQKKRDSGKIGKEKLELSTEKEKLNADQHDLCGKIAVLDKKSPNFNSNEFREVTYLKFELSQKIKEIESVNKKMAQLTKNCKILPRLKGQSEATDLLMGKLH